MDACGVCEGDDSTCSGCTDEEASNYDAEALVDDGSCIPYDDIMFSLCPTIEPNGLNNTVELFVKSSLSLGQIQFYFEFNEGLGEIEIQGVGDVNGLAEQYDFALGAFESDGYGVIYGAALQAQYEIPATEMVAWVRFTTLTLSNSLDTAEDIMFAPDDTQMAGHFEIATAGNYVAKYFSTCQVEE
jgi:hypothetical protein